MNFLIDYNLRGQAPLLWGTIAAEGWLEVMSIRFVGFEEVGLLENSSDRLVWQVAQTNQMIIVTANRIMLGDDSLEQVIREDNTMRSLPIVSLHRLRLSYECSPISSQTLLLSSNEGN